jgi:hypothetical protein
MEGVSWEWITGGETATPLPGADAPQAPAAPQPSAQTPAPTLERAADETDELTGTRDR